MKTRLMMRGEDLPAGILEAIKERTIEKAGVIAHEFFLELADYLIKYIIGNSLEEEINAELYGEMLEKIHLGQEVEVLIKFKIPGDPIKEFNIPVQKEQLIALDIIDLRRQPKKEGGD